MRVAYLVLGSLLFLCLLPVLVALAALALARGMGCMTDGGGFTPCMVFGTGLSDTLTTAMTLHWLGLVTLPFAALCAVALLLLAFVHLIRYLRR
jgi:hypothetical protein